MISGRDADLRAEFRPCDDREVRAPEQSRPSTGSFGRPTVWPPAAAAPSSDRPSAGFRPSPVRRRGLEASAAGTQMTTASLVNILAGGLLRLRNHRSRC